MAGRNSKCPHCQAPLQIPKQSSLGQDSSSSTKGRSESEESPTAKDDQPAPNGEEDENPFAQFAVFDPEIQADDGERSDQPALVYAPGELLSKAKRRGKRVDPQRVAVPRSVLYAQGVLLAVIAVTFFVLGLLAGKSLNGDRAMAHQPRPCVLSGTVRVQSPSGEKVFDAGAVVVVVPQKSRPESNAKWPVDNLRPDEPAPDKDHPTLRAIREVGGDYARVDEKGRYRLQLPDVGEYFVLFISQRASRPSEEQAKMRDLAQMGRYFSSALELISERQYRWKTARVRANQMLDVIF